MSPDPALSPAAAALDRGVVTVDVISDVVCPWCYVGKRRLEAAVAHAEKVELHWRPFQLDATIPRAGLDRQAYLGAKFGSLAKVDAIHDRLAATGREVGIDFRFDRITRAPNTLDAHRLIRWAAAAGRQDAVVEALFRGYFVEGLDIGDSEVLARIAGACGLDHADVRHRFATDADADGVDDEIASAARLGVSGVPFFIFAGKYAVSGAQPAEVLAAAIAKAREAAGAD